MFENPLAVVFIVVIIGMSLIRDFNKLCSVGDLFNGKLFSREHHAEHIDREFRGFFYVLAIGVFAGFIVLISNCLTESASAKKRVFIQDLVNSKEIKADIARHKAGYSHNANHSAKLNHSSPAGTGQRHPQQHHAGTLQSK